MVAPFLTLRKNSPAAQTARADALKNQWVYHYA
jgi:hypothetical protein